LLLLGGNGGVSWAEQRVPSGLTALLVAAVPLWAVAIDWLRPRGVRPGRATMLGLVTGFVGVAILANPRAADAARVDPVGAAVLIAAAISWAGGSIYSRHAQASGSPLMGTAANMLAGAAALLVAGVLAGDLSRFHPSAVSARSALSLAYLVVFGSIAGFTAYLWLLRNTSPAKATTYAYVNPIVAIVLGWAFGGEPITPRVLVAAVVIISGVVMIAWLPGVRVWLASRRRESTAGTGSG
jgi:drug/metabolite transporter (DMT)-like permease